MKNSRRGSRRTTNTCGFTFLCAYGATLCPLFLPPRPSQWVLRGRERRWYCRGHQGAFQVILWGHGGTTLMAFRANREEGIRWWSLFISALLPLHQSSPFSSCTLHVVLRAESSFLTPIQSPSSLSRLFVVFSLLTLHSLLSSFSLISEQFLACNEMFGFEGVKGFESHNQFSERLI